MSCYARRRRLREPAEFVGPPSPPRLPDVADHDNLLRVLYALMQDGGRAPGPDGIRYEDLGRREAGELARRLSDVLLAGMYRPGPGRHVQVPKLRGGHRTLTLRNLTDRIVAAALNDALTPWWDPWFVSWSMGFRPGRGVHLLLAELEAVVTLEGRWVLAVDDVRRAFDNVRIDDALADHVPYLRDDRLLDLIGRVLRGGDDAKVVGIDQGSAYSPTALNARLHHAHDQHIDGCSVSPPRLRYSDNLAYACRSVSEGRQALAQSQSLLEAAGFTLKGEDGPPVDLRQGGHVQLLGFQLLHEGGRLRYGLGEDAWQKLAQNLSMAHEAKDPTTTARMAVRGWIDAYGPAFANRRDDVLNRVLTTAAGFGFREVDDRERLLSRWKASWGRWRHLCHEVRHGRRRANESDGGG
jgi:hypothetical protein